MAYEQAGYAQEAAYVPKNLLSGGTHTTRKVTIISGQNLTAGAVLGKITASSKYNLSLLAAADGSQTPDMVLAHDVDASAGDKEAIAIETCTAGLVSTALTIGTGHTLASIREGLRAKGLPIDD